jgi:hypothetical protein
MRQVSRKKQKAEQIRVSGLIGVGTEPSATFAAVSLRVAPVCGTIAPARCVWTPAWRKNKGVGEKRQLKRFVFVTDTLSHPDRLLPP